jgi:hypothetical protein
MAGWLGAGQVLDVASGGSYAIAALEVANPASPQVLRLPKRDSNEVCYVSMRHPIGDDTALCASYQNTLHVHRAAGALPTRTCLVANLAAGQGWADRVNGIQFTHQGVSGNTAGVGIGFGGATCTRQPPGVTPAPAMQTAAPGATLAYALTVKNNNSAACPIATFNLAQELPAGLSGGFAAPSVTLASGASSTLGWNVTSAATTAEATYPLTATASESAAVSVN